MLRKTWIVLGAVALIILAYVTAFAAEEVKQPVVADATSGGAAEATTWTVCSSGCDFTSIQAAVDAAGNGDTIELGAETFREAISITTFVHVLGSGTDQTILVSPDDSPAVAVNNYDGVELAHLTIEQSSVGIEVNGTENTLIRDSIIRGNRVGIHGGDLVIANVVITGNGTGVVILSGSPLLTSSVTGSTISDNEGWGLRMTGPSFTIGNSTVSRNGSGIDIELLDPYGLWYVGGNTIYDNVDIGVHLPPGTCELESVDCGHNGMYSNIIAGNGTNLVNDFQSEFLFCNNLLDDDPGIECFHPVFGYGTNLVNTHPMLLALADNGGPTPTHALAPDSPAIDSVSDFYCSGNDQRGVARPQDGDGDSVARCDIGAYEYQRPLTTWSVCSRDCDFNSIQAAVDAAAGGDTIELGPETFIETVSVSKAVHILGKGAEHTVIKTLTDSTAVTASNGSLLSHLSIEESGWGVKAANATIRDSVIRGNVQGILAGNGVQLSNTSIVENEGIGLYMDVRPDDPNFTYPPQGSVINSTISGNGDGAEIVGHCASDGEPGNECYVNFVGNTVYDNDGFGVRTIDTCHCEFPPCGCISWYIQLSYNLLAHNGVNLDNRGTRLRRWYNLLIDFDTDPRLLPLADNGGPTPTHALAPDSPAVDAGGDEDCPPTDQRGVPRPQDGDGDGVAKCDIGAYELGVLSVTIDIKPDNFPNSTNPYARGAIPVAILGSDAFDVADVDETTLRFGPGEAPIAHLRGHLQDVNSDGQMDLITHYRTQDTGIACGDESATLTGETLDGQAIEGTDSIETVGCRDTRRPAIWMKDQDGVGQRRRDGPVSIERK